jgi:hypothetical protein
MVEANVKIIEELKLFLEIVSKDEGIRKLFTVSKRDFSRDRKLPLEKLVSLIINMPKRSLSVELQSFFDFIDPDSKACTKGALSLQRGKLSAIFFRVWNKWLVDCFYLYYGDKVKRWRGFILQAVDGSGAYLVNTTEVIEHFGTHSNQHKNVSVAMGQVMQVHDILNDITVWGDIYPNKESEQAIMNTRVPYLFKDSLTIFDRGYPSFALMYLMLNEEEPRHFVMRCKLGFNKEIKQFMLSSKKSVVIYLSPTSEAIKTLRANGVIITANATIKIRAVKVKLSSGIIEVLLTDLYNEKIYAIEDLKQLYGLRWGIETAYGKQKNQLQMEQFSGHRVICIRQDYAACIFVSNLQSLIEKQCEDYLKIKRGKYYHAINGNISIASLKNNIVELFLKNDVENILMKLQKAFERHTIPIIPNRQNERSKKNKRLKGKYQTFTNYKRAI